MSFNHQKHLLINQLQVKPLDFVTTLHTLTDEAILTFLCQIFLEGELNLFHNLILYLGQEHQTPDSLYHRILKILLQYQDDIYFYVLDNLVPIILNYHLSIRNPYFHTSILHLSNYEPLLVKTLHFIEKTEELANLVIMIKEVPQINKPLIRTVKQYDEELSDFLERHINPISQVQKMNQELEALNNRAREEQNNKSKATEILTDENNNVLSSSHNENINLLNNLDNQSNNHQSNQPNNQNNNNQSNHPNNLPNNLSNNYQPNNQNNNNQNNHPNNESKHLPNNQQPNHLENINTLQKAEETINKMLEGKASSLLDEINMDEEDNVLDNETNNNQKKISKLNQELRTLEEHPQKIVSNTSNLLEQAIDNISNFSEMNHLGIQQQNLENNINQRNQSVTTQEMNLTSSEENNLNTQLITQVQEDSVLAVPKKKKPANYEEFVGQIPIEKMELLATFTRNLDKDAWMLLAKNRNYLTRELKPACERVEKLINKPTVISNKLGTNYKLENLSSLGKKIHTDRKPVLYFDISEAILCYGKNQIKDKISICNHHNVYSNYFYPYEKNRFGLEKQLYNLDIWLLLLQNINSYQKSDDSKVGSLLDLYQLVIILPKHIYQKLVSSYQEGSINVIQKQNYFLICADDKLTSCILSFYLFAKFFTQGDMIMTPNPLNFLKHGEGIALNGKYKYMEEYLPFVANDMEMLKEMLGSLYPEYNFITEKIDLQSIPQKKYSKKKTHLQRKKSKGKKEVVKTQKEKVVKKKRKYSRKA